MQEKSYYALAAFCENMGEEILPFLDPLMGRLLAALQNSSRVLQETCMVWGKFSICCNDCHIHDEAIIGLLF